MIVPRFLLFQRSPELDSFGLRHSDGDIITSIMICTVCAQISISVSEASKLTDPHDNPMWTALTLERQFGGGVKHFDSKP